MSPAYALLLVGRVSPIVAATSVVEEEAPFRYAKRFEPPGELRIAAPPSVLKFDAVPLTVQAPPVVAVPRPFEVVRVNESSASAALVGGVVAATVTWPVLVPVSPSSSRTVRVTV